MSYTGKCCAGCNAFLTEQEVKFYNSHCERCIQEEQSVLEGITARRRATVDPDRPKPDLATIVDRQGGRIMQRMDKLYMEFAGEHGRIPEFREQMTLFVQAILETIYGTMP